MAKIKLPPYLKWRDGRPRWEPGPTLRAAGWKGADLREDGVWLPLAKAIEAAEAQNQKVADWRAGKTDADSASEFKLPIKRPTRNFDELYRRWSRSPEFGLLSTNTRRDYYEKIELFLRDFGDEPVAAVGRAILKGYWRKLYRERGHHMANGILAVVRTMLTYATDLEWISTNPGFNQCMRHQRQRTGFVSGLMNDGFDKTALDMET